MDKIALGIIIICISLYLLSSPIEFIGGIGVLYIVYLLLIKPHQRTEEEEREAQNAITEMQAKEDGYEYHEDNNIANWEEEDEDDQEPQYIK